MCAGGVRVAQRPLVHSLSEHAAAEERFKIINPDLDDVQTKVALALAQAEHKSVTQHNMVAATAKDFYGEDSKAVASTYYPPAQDAKIHNKSGPHVGGGAPLQQPQQRGMK
jgi:hypothetical protein